MWITLLFLNDLVEEDYAKRVFEGELEDTDGKAWYIPHHGVYHPKKGNIRVILDFGANLQATSLNCSAPTGNRFYH